ncbi:glycosyltransferase family protein [Conexibacter woesei]|uniref:Response regulator receiver protein n=1 Tax=Conexibacter woesei (strain DSM 14684 / CCUG 47730 / CIP 108061 / JCM 11494 / NBRC 100937 / ID131577) TaxID=469383 RepID=D3F2V4_CONWI|nr:transcriptional regulator [Conexibacter woesei]ADB54235.1 response regulator receiver protein [Conexibacter woesei DSM 14684]
MSADVLIVSLGTTAGWRNADPLLAAAIEHAGASVAIAAAGPVPRVRTFALTDLVQARATRAAALRGIREHAPRALIYSSTTAALLAPRPGAIWFDSPALDNRPGRHGLWQRLVEPRRMCAAPLLLPMSEGSLAPLPAAVRAATPAVLLPVPVEPSGPSGDAAAGPSGSSAAAGTRDVAAIAYAADPVKKGLDRILAAWRAARRDGERLLVAGQDGPLGDGAEGTGLLAPDEYRALLRRARVFVAAPLREDHGIAQLEALADGCRLVTAPAPGAYPALALARTLDPRYVGDDLAGALRAALDDAAASEAAAGPPDTAAAGAATPGAPDDYAERAAALLAPYRRASFDAAVAQRVLPLLLR